MMNRPRHNDDIIGVTSGLIVRRWDRWHRLMANPWHRLLYAIGTCFGISAYIYNPDLIGKVHSDTRRATRRLYDQCLGPDGWQWTQTCNDAWIAHHVDTALLIAAMLCFGMAIALNKSQRRKTVRIQ